MQKVHKCGLQREKGYLYFVDKEGDISRCTMNRKGRSKSAPTKEKVLRSNVKRESGFMYFVDKEGDVSRTKQARGRKPKKEIN